MCASHMRIYVPIPSVLNLCENGVLNDVYLGFGVIVRRDGGQAFARSKLALDGFASSLFREETTR